MPSWILVLRRKHWQSKPGSAAFPKKYPLIAAMIGGGGLYAGLTHTHRIQVRGYYAPYARKKLEHKRIMPVMEPQNAAPWNAAVRRVSTGIKK